MSLDFNDAPSQQSGDFELLPVGTIVKLHMTVRPGGDTTDSLLTQSQRTDAKYLDCEFAICSSPYHGRRLWQNMTVSGGSVDEQGRSKGGLITATTLRAIINSARKINPDDDSEQARSGRVLTGYADFTGMEFVAKIGKEAGKDGYPDKNKISVVIEPGKPNYDQVMAGETVVPGGVAAKSGAPAAPAQAPSWAASAPAPEQTQAPAPAAAPAAQPAATNGGVPSWAQ